jgi:ribonuclease HII
MNPSEYENRKLFLEDLKTLTKDEHEEIFRIIKRNQVEFSENSNGIFFDLVSISSEIFQLLQQFMELCKTQRKVDSERTHEMDLLREQKA